MLNRGAQAIAHRGPDEEGFYAHPGQVIGLAHRRLNVMAPANGSQPLSNEDGRIRAIVNGEFYGADETREHLIARGHSFRTQSDSEILVHLYEEHGTGCLDFLRGEFAFVLWDEQRQRVFAARDRFGIKPLLSSRRTASLMLASEAKALFAAGVPPEWDRESFQFASSIQYLPPDRTLFAGIQMVPPGHFLVAQRDSCSIRSYWEIPEPTRESSIPEPELIELCRQHIEEAVRCRLRADARVCFQLSGGLDSSSVAGIAAQNSTEPIDVFTISFPEKKYSEFDVAERTASFLNARLHRVEISQDELLQQLPAAVAASEGLSINGHVSAKYILHKRIHDAGFKVVLTGEGADEVFFGYTHLRMDHWGLIDQPVPASLLAADVTSKGMMLPDGDSLSLARVREQCGFVPSWVKAKATLGWKVRGLLRDSFRGELGGRDPVCELTASQLDKPCASRARNAWTKTAFAGYILKTLGDGTEMPHSVEGRVPYLDHKLWEFLAAVPVNSLISAQRDKPLLRDSVREFLTAEVFERPKHPFDAPPISVFAGSYGREFIRDHLQTDAARSQPFFCPAQIESRLNELEQHDDLRQAWDPALMMFLSTVFLQRSLASASVGIGAAT